jgi:hypothetical protein
MFADSSRHQEETIITGMKGRLEAYLPENKVFHYLQPTRLQMTKEDHKNREKWVDTTQPTPKSSIQEKIIDCSGLSKVYLFSQEMEWKYLIEQVQN